MRDVFEIVQTLGQADTPTPAQPDGFNRIIQGDCLAILRALPDASFHLIYLDPPFFTGKAFHLHDSTPDPRHAFNDAWEGGLQAYLAWLQVRLEEMRRLLTPTGALLVHLDWHAVHYVKVLLDHLFGYTHFQNEFVWYYSGGGASQRRFARKHDTILYYTNSATEWTFHADRVREPYKWTRGQRRADGSARDYTRGKLPDDVWEHHALLPWAEENLGYPTQKPEALLSRLIQATTNDGDVVGDFFSGSGTTAAVAQRLNRRWVTADLDRVAVCLTADRVSDLLVPGSVALSARRARARAQERFLSIIADDERLGVAPDTLVACGLSLLPLPGFTVERFLTERTLP
jgi:DNA modification methylase